jgi:hypothetical protein
MVIAIELRGKQMNEQIGIWVFTQRHLKSLQNQKNTNICMPDTGLFEIKVQSGE